jgi:hypothetical protein
VPIHISPIASEYRNQKMERSLYEDVCFKHAVRNEITTLTSRQRIPGLLQILKGTAIKVQFELRL